MLHMHKVNFMAAHKQFFEIVRGALLNRQTTFCMCYLYGNLLKSPHNTLCGTRDTLFKYGVQVQEHIDKDSILGANPLLP